MYKRQACTCKRKAHEKEQEELRRIEVQRRIRELRRQGIGDTVCQTWTFANDRGYNPEQMRICQRYVEQWAKVRSENIGLLLYGGVGAGKSYAAYCIANALIDKGIFVLATSLPKLLSSIQSNFGDQSEVLKDIEEAELVVIDDRGAVSYTHHLFNRGKKPFRFLYNPINQKVIQPIVWHKNRRALGIEGDQHNAAFVALIFFYRSFLTVQHGNDKFPVFCSRLDMDKDIVPLHDIWLHAVPLDPHPYIFLGVFPIIYGHFSIINRFRHTIPTLSLIHISKICGIDSNFRSTLLSGSFFI